MDETPAHLSVIDSRISRLEAAVEGLTDTVTEYIRNSGRTNWGWLISAIGALGAFIYLHTTPIKDQALNNATLLAEQQNQKIESAYQQGKNERDIAENAHELDMMWQEFFAMMKTSGEVKFKLDHMYNEQLRRTAKVYGEQP